MPAHCKSAHRTDVMTVVSPHFSSLLPILPPIRARKTVRKNFWPPRHLLHCSSITLHCMPSLAPSFRETDRPGEWRRYTTNHFPRLSLVLLHLSSRLPTFHQVHRRRRLLRLCALRHRLCELTQLVPSSLPPLSSLPLSLLRVPLQDHLNFRNPDLLGWASLLQLIPRAESMCSGPLFQLVKADQ